MNDLSDQLMLTMVDGYAFSPVKTRQLESKWGPNRLGRSLFPTKGQHK